MAKDGLIYTYIPENTHKKAKGLAGMRGLDLPEAYELLVQEGLKALGYDPETFK